MQKLILLFFLFLSGTCICQTINIQGGVSTSSMDWVVSNTPRTRVYDEKITNIYASLGIEYLNRKYFSFSSWVSYIVKGGASMVTFTDQAGNDLYTKKQKEKLSYISLATEFNLKYKIKKITPFIHVGPRVDLLINKTAAFNNSGINTISYGLIAGAGVKYNIIRKLSVGVNGGYLINFNKVSDKNNIDDKTFLVNALIGIKI